MKNLRKSQEMLEKELQRERSKKPKMTIVEKPVYV